MISNPAGTFIILTFLRFLKTYFGQILNNLKILNRRRYSDYNVLLSTYISTGDPYRFKPHQFIQCYLVTTKLLLYTSHHLSYIAVPYNFNNYWIIASASNTYVLGFFLHYSITIFAGHYVFPNAITYSFTSMLLNCFI